MPKFAVILAAAGKSSRFVGDQIGLGIDDTNRKKVFRELKGRPVWLRSAEAFINRDDVGQVLLVLAKDDIDWFKEKFRHNLAFIKIDIVEGGAERADSVQNALAQVADEIDYVAIHDAARPVLASSWITDIFNAAIEHGAAIPGIPVSSTLKRVTDHAISETVPRENLWQAQTPQAFRLTVLKEAYSKRDGQVSTDDAQLVEQIGRRVQMVAGSPLNIKITDQDDLRLAAALLELLPKEESLGGLF